MIQLILAAFLAIVPHGPTLEEIDTARETLRPLLDALAIVESNGKDNAVGDKGKALGRYQIWEIYWADAISYAPVIGGEYKDVTNKEYAERILVAYFLRYARKAVECKDFEHLARVHNGGPNGYKAKGTLGYWRKVEKALAKS